MFSYAQWLILLGITPYNLQVHAHIIGFPWAVNLEGMAYSVMNISIYM